MADQFTVAEGVIPITARDETAAGVAEAKARMAGLKAVAEIDAQDEKLRRKVAACQRELDALAKKKATPEVDARTEAAQAKMRNLRAQAEQLDRMRVTVTAEANTAVANARLREVGRAANQSRGSVAGMNSEGRAIAGSFIGAAKVVGILGGIGAAAAAAGGLVGALPAALGSLAGIGGVLVGSFGGIGDALKGYKDDQDAAAESTGKSTSAAAANARAMRDATQTVSDARRNAGRVARDTAQQVADADENQARVARQGAQAVSDAQREQTRTREEGARAVQRASAQVEDALDDQRRAQDDLNDSYAEAQRQLEDLVDRTNDYGLSVEGAEISLQRQQARTNETLASSTATALDRREALYDLAVAEDRLRDAQRDSTRSQDELRAAQAAGIAGSEVVTSARDRLTAASDRTRDAEQTLRDTISQTSQANQDAAENTARVSQQAAEANADASRAFTRAQQQSAEANEDAARQVTDALQGVRDVVAQQAEQAEAAAGSTSKFADAMRKLTPEARGLVDQLISMAPLVERLKTAGQSEFLPGLTQMLRDSEGLFPIVEDYLRRTSSIMGESARDLGTLFKNPEFKRDLDDMLRSSDVMTSSLTRNMVKFLGDFVSFGAGMSSTTEGFATLLDDTFDGIGGMFDAMEPHSDSFKRTLEALGRILKVLLPALGELLGWLADEFAPVLEDVAGWLERNKDDLDEWALAIGGAIALVKGVKTAGNFIRWASEVQGALGGIAGKADGAAGKVGKLDGLLRGLKAIGAIGVVIAVDQATNGAISNSLNVASGQAPIDQNDPRRDMFGALPPVPGDENDIRNLPATLQRIKGDMGKNWEELKGMFSGLFSSPPATPGDELDVRNLPSTLQRIKGSSDKNWSELTTGASNWGRDTWSSVTGWWGRTFTDSDSWWSRTGSSIGGHMTGAKDWAVGKAGELSGGVSGWWGRTFSDSDSWFNRTRGSIGGHMGGAKDWAVERAGALQSGVSGWWGRTFTDSDSWFSRTRNSIGDKMGGARNWAVERASSLWSGVSGWWGRTFGDTDSTFARIRNTAGDKMREAKDRVVGWARDMKDRAGASIRDLADGIGRKWDEVKGFFARPIKWVIDAVYNGTIRRLWERADGLLGGILPNFVPLATGGPVPGFSPTRTADNIPAMLTAREFVQPVDSVNYYGTDVMEAMRRRQIPREFFSDGGQVRPAYAQGGPVSWQDLWGAVRGRFPSATLNSAVRRGDPGEHGAGRAIDVGGPMLAINRWIAGAFPESHELIHTPGINLFNGRPHTYNAATRAGHYDHVHWARAEKGKGVLARIGDWASGVWDSVSTYFRDSMAGIFDGPAAAIRGTLGSLFPGTGLQNRLPRDGGNMILDGVRDMLFGKADEQDGMSGGGGIAAGGTGPVADQVRAVARRFGWGEGPQWNAIVKLLGGESSWNPTIKNPTSSAYGLFQFLDATWATVGGRKTSNPGEQAEYGFRYIRQRYGDPVGAYRTWLSRSPHWYHQGGSIPGVGDRLVAAEGGERVLTTAQNEAFERMVAALERQPATDRSLIVNVQQVAGDPQETARFAALALRGVA